MSIDHAVLLAEIDQAPTLSDDEIAVRTLFVHEYLKDFQPVQAAIRCGFQITTAKEYAQAFLGEPYVQRLIADARLRAPTTDQENEEPLSPRPDYINDPDLGKQRVKSTLHEIASTGHGSTQQIQALKILYDYYHMGDEHKSKDADLTLVHGGVMEVPGMLSVDDWEAASMQSQDKLKKDVRE